MTSVLAFTPVWRLEPETVEAMHGQDFGGDWHWLLGYANPQPERRDPRGVKNVLHQYTEARRIFLAGDWDWLWIVESDIIPPADTLTTLLRVAQERDADTVAAPYLYRRPWPDEVPALLTHYSHEARNRGEPWERPYPQGVTLVTNGGLGCLLVRRAVLEAIPFRNGGPAHCDTYWNDDVWRAGFTKQYGVWSHWCGHKTPEGMTICPK